MSLNFKSSIFIILFIFNSVLQAQSLPSFELNSEWRTSIKSMVNSQKKLSLKEKKKLLIFSLHTGFEHWTIPHTEAVMEIIARNSEVFEIDLSKDISVFEKDQLSKYDVVILNNNCSKGDRRDIFWDVLKTESSLHEHELFT